ncbi:MAG: Na(+)/H(+) antiporter subunit B [Planctomycetes bacterium]|nr:Na(+)/H(+) antiporter subunit B [Planctomycetota bacterium]
MKDLVVLRVVARWNIPFMVVFGLYVQTHGELGPGGGFQAGVIIAAGFLLYGMIFGAQELRRIIPRWVTDIAAACGVLIYAGVGFWAMGNGYEFLDHAALNPANPGGAEPWGMTLVEYGVGLTVAAVMITIFNEITEGTAPEDEPVNKDYDNPTEMDLPRR